MAQMAPSVRCARVITGARKALTPLLTASTPVIAVQPAAKDLSSSQRLSAWVGLSCPGGGTAGCG